MPSPFPGMDPYLEGYLWPDVHHRLATEISRRLGPRLRPHYVARLEIYVVADESPQAEIGVMYPDVEVLVAGRPRAIRETALAATAPASVERPPPITQAPLTISVLFPVEVRLVNVEIRDAAHNELVTSIEILSPINKREPGLSQYRQKQRRLYQATVHTLEIDLLRRGTRALAGHPRLPHVPYLITLTRAHARVVEVWPLHLSDLLPVVPVPLRDPDPDVPLELGPALATIYDEAAYELSADYRQPPPPPPLSTEEVGWVKEITSIR